MSTGAAVPDTPAGRQLAWFLEQCRLQGRDLTLEEVGRHIAGANGVGPADSLERFHTADPRPHRIASVKTESRYSIEAKLDYGDDRPMNAAISVDDEPPHRINRVFWSRAIPDDIAIRTVTASDGAALNDLEIRAPMELGATTLTYDRGADFLGFGRLMGDNVCFVAERDGQLLGLACGALHPTRIGGQRYDVMLLHHLRVPVEQRKGGIFSSLNSYVFGAFDGRSDGAYGYTALENAEGMRIGGPGTWSVTVYRAIIDVASLAGPSHGRVVTPADVDEVVDLLNRAHDNEEAYVPYTSGSFAARMERAPELYSWDKILLGEGAVVGVWPAGIRVTADGVGGRSISTRAVVLDHGFVPGAADEMVRLLRSWGTRLRELRHTELTFITSEGSPSLPLVTALGAHTDPFSFRMSVPEPEGTRERGLYVDAVYF